MKKILFIFVPILFIFSACKYNPPCYSIAVSINTDENTIFYDKSSYIQTKVDAEFTGKYFWIPFDPKDSAIQNVVSTDDNTITITNIDFDNQTFTALAKHTGTAKIHVLVKNNTFSSLVIYVTN